MNVNLYAMTGESNRIDKTAYLTLDRTVSGSVKYHTADFESILLDISTGHDNINYVYIPDYHRYYFVQKREQINKTVVRLTLSCDVLYTYKDDILPAVAHVTQSANYNHYQQLDTEARIDLHKISFANNFLAQPCNVLITEKSV